VCPSPIDHETLSGIATAVALTPPAVAVARKLCQIWGSIQSHELRFTMLNDDGSRLTTGEGSESESAARIANALGATKDGEVATGTGEGNHDRAPL